ncbi:hypothetical protein P5673_019636, partial [Acropora cervicornis]
MKTGSPSPLLRPIQKLCLLEEEKNLYHYASNKSSPMIKFVQLACISWLRLTSPPILSVLKAVVTEYSQKRKKKKERKEVIELSASEKKCWGCVGEMLMNRACFKQLKRIRETHATNLQTLDLVIHPDWVGQ